jgi:sporulation protein YlmC with PRC-barrel domain
MDVRKIRGMAVVTLAEAGRVGQVTDLLFDLSPLRAVALRVRAEEGDVLVPFDRIREIGADAITTDSAEALGVQSREGRHMPGIDEISKLKVVDEHGTLLGTITELDIDPSDGHVAKVDVRKGEILGVGGERQTVDADRILSVGQEVLTVRAID